VRLNMRQRSPARVTIPGMASHANEATRVRAHDPEYLCLRSTIDSQRTRSALQRLSVVWPMKDSHEARFRSEQDDRVATSRRYATFWLGRVRKVRLRHAQGGGAAADTTLRCLGARPG
jgi:hypothetical protein